MNYQELKRGAVYLITNINRFNSDSYWTGTAASVEKECFKRIIDYFNKCNDSYDQFSNCLIIVTNIKKYGSFYAEQKYNYENNKDNINPSIANQQLQLILNNFNAEVAKLKTNLELVKKVDMNFNDVVNSMMCSLMKVTFSNLEKAISDFNHLIESLRNISESLRNYDFSHYNYISSSMIYNRYLPAFNVNYKQGVYTVAQNYSRLASLCERLKNRMQIYHDNLYDFEDGKAVEVELDERINPDATDTSTPKTATTEYKPIEDKDIEIDNPTKITDWDKVKEGLLSREQVRKWASSIAWSTYGSSYSSVRTANCFTFARVRASIINGEEITDSYRSAKAFGSAAADSPNYNTSNTPTVGAIVIFTGSGYDSTNGHAAVVEAINDDGSIVISESNYGNDFNTRTLTPTEYNNTGTTFITKRC